MTETLGIQGLLHGLAFALGQGGKTDQGGQADQGAGNHLLFSGCVRPASAAGSAMGFDAAER